jgi:hypothetical protein
MVVRAEQHCVAVGGKLAAASEWLDGVVGFAAEGLGDLLGNDRATEDPGERVSDEAL